MRIIPSIVSAALVAVAFSMLGAAPASSADTQPAPAAVAADSGQSVDIDGCPGAASGKPCCAGCQEKQAKLEAGEAQPASGGCPCKERARRLREAQERARQQ